jgi:hypothetical protein
MTTDPVFIHPQRRVPPIRLLAIAIVVVALAAGSVFAQVRRLRGQTVYVPVYSHIYHGDQDKNPFLLTATLSIRNTDPQFSIKVTVLDYYDSRGQRLRSYQDNPVTVAPMGSTRMIVAESDKSGGSGANFIVKWESAQAVTAPIIEAVMIGTKVQQGISFTSRGQAIAEVD